MSKKGATFRFIFLSTACAQIFLCSCYIQHQSPNNVSFEKMTDLMSELYYMQAALETLPSSIKDSLVFKAKSEILVKYGVSDSAYSSALKYYNENPKALLELEKAIESVLQNKIKTDSFNLLKLKPAQDSNALLPK